MAECYVLRGDVVVGQLLCVVLCLVLGVVSRAFLRAFLRVLVRGAWNTRCGIGGMLAIEHDFSVARPRLGIVKGCE